MRTISLDFETFYDKDFSVVDLGYWKYARDPRCAPYLISVCDGAEAWAGEPKDFNFASLEGATLVSHNSAFDEEVALAQSECGGFVIPGLKTFGMTHWHCSLNMSAYLWNVRSLADACKVGLGIDVNKGVRDRAKGKTVLDMQREGWWGDMLQYARLDAQYCWQLWDKHNAKWPEFERRLSRLTIDQGRRGVRIDVEALEDGIRLMQEVIFRAKQNLPWVARGKAPASPIGIAEECRSVGIPPPPVKAHDPEAAEAWEARYAPDFPFVMALRNIRKAKKTLATLETISLRLREEDETVAFSLKYAGAHTLRWAGDAGWNLQNQNKLPLFVDENLSFVYDKKRERELDDDFSAGPSACFGTLKNGIRFFNMRGLIIPRRGMKLAPVDSSQIEPRVLNHLIGNRELLDKVRAGMSIYEAFARTALGWKGGDLKTEDKKLYNLGKADVLGLGFRAGWEKFITVAWVMAGLDITEGDEEFAKAASVDGLIHRRRKVGDKWQYLSWPSGLGVEIEQFQGLPNSDFEECVFVRKIRKVRGQDVDSIVALPVYGMRSRVTVQQFRQNNPKNVALWEHFDDALHQASLAEEDLVVQGPHGGCLTYRKIRRESREQINQDTGEKYIGKIYTGEIAGKRYVLHGGVLTENLVQWVARMVFAERMLALHDKLQAEDPEQWVLFSVHDEAVPEIRDPADPKVRAKEIEADLSVTPSWLEGCPLAAECKVLDRYAK